MGGSFDYGYCECGLDAEGSPLSASIAEGACFFVLTITLPILDAATGGRVTPQRLWRLALSRGHFIWNGLYGIEGTDYGSVEAYQEGDFQNIFGELQREDIRAFEDKGTPEEIAELLRAAGYWMWMRPDRCELFVATL